MATVRVRLPVLRALRHRMTQRQLARLAGVRQTTISRLESGQTRGIEFNTLAGLCLALDCTPNDLFEIADEEEAPAAQRLPRAAGKGKADASGSVSHDADLYGS